MYLKSVEDETETYIRMRVGGLSPGSMTSVPISSPEGDWLRGALSRPLPLPLSLSLSITHTTFHMVNQRWLIADPPPSLLGIYLSEGTLCFCH